MIRQSAASLSGGARRPALRSPLIAVTIVILCVRAAGLRPARPPLVFPFFFSISLSLSLFFFARLPALVDGGLDVRESLAKASEEKKGFPLLAR